MLSEGGDVAELMASNISLNLNRPPYDRVWNIQKLSETSQTF